MALIYANMIIVSHVTYKFSQNWKIAGISDVLHGHF